jgi:hypothetical protein
MRSQREEKNMKEAKTGNEIVGTFTHKRRTYEVRKCESCDDVTLTLSCDNRQIVRCVFSVGNMADLRALPGSMEGVSRSELVKFVIKGEIARFKQIVGATT